MISSREIINYMKLYNQYSSEENRGYYNVFIECIETDKGTPFYKIGYFISRQWTVNDGVVERNGIRSDDGMTFSEAIDIFDRIIQDKFREGYVEASLKGIWEKPKSEIEIADIDINSIDLNPLNQFLQT